MTGGIVMKFGEVLIKLGFINGQKLDIALQEQEYTLNTVGFSEPLGMIFLRNGIINEDQHSRAVIEYFKQVITDKEKPDYTRKLALIAIKALESESSPGKLTNESKITLLNKIEECEEKILQIENSVLSGKDVIIAQLSNTIDMIKKDIETLA
jgi:uncharacterized protein (UPF0147 family)